MQKTSKETVRSLPPEQEKITGYQGVELIFYGQINLVKDADALLATFGYGRAHFRAMYIIAHHPNITGNGLLARLKITNQSLSRVMKQLLIDGMVRQENGIEDRRHRRHTLSPKGAALHRKTTDLQLEALFKAYESAGRAAVEGFLRVLHELVPLEDRSLLNYPVADE